MAWLLGSHPDRQLAYVSYASTFAEDKSRKARQIAQAAGVPISALAWARKNWRTGVADGGVWATAIAGPMTGQGFHLMVIDDPVKDRVTAESATLRQQHYDWFNDVAYTRLEPTGACLVVQTRWHPDDLAGRLIKDGWECVNLPALDENDEPLWPERWTKAKLLEIRNQLGDYGWTSLYMGQPRSRDGAVFRDVHFYDDAPRGFRASIGVDLAYTAKTQADWSVAVAMAEAGGEFYVLDVKRAQAAPPEFAKSLRTLAASYPGAPMLWYTSSIEREVATLLRGAADIPLRAKIAKGDKFVRSQPVAAAWNAGRIHIPRSAKWAPQFVEEVCGFTGVNDRNDDQVDALAAAFDALGTQRKAPDLRDLATFQKVMPKARMTPAGSHMDDWDD